MIPANTLVVDLGFRANPARTGKCTTLSHPRGGDRVDHRVEVPVFSGDLIGRDRARAGPRTGWHSQGDEHGIRDRSISRDVSHLFAAWVTLGVDEQSTPHLRANNSQFLALARRQGGYTWLEAVSDVRLPAALWAKRRTLLSERVACCCCEHAFR